MKTISSTIHRAFVLVALASAALLPQAQAVVPPPDGGYPGYNTAEGENALYSLTTGAGNTAIGSYSLFSNREGSFNTATGIGALLLNNGRNNTALGATALVSNTDGDGNTAVGVNALYSNTGASFGNGNNNTAVGINALYANTGATNGNGDGNTAVGSYALAASTGTLNIALGASAGKNVTTADSVICIGAIGNNVPLSCYIDNIFDATSSGGDAVFVNSNGRLGTHTSSRRFKEKIKPMENASEALFALKPVTFRYKQEVDPEGTGLPQFGLVAEDVEKANPDLIIRDKKGRPHSVRYEAINAMLLNEFLKEHRKNEAQEATIARLEKQLEAVTATLQKVSAQLELSKPAPQTALNNQ